MGKCSRVPHRAVPFHSHGSWEICATQVVPENILAKNSALYQPVLGHTLQYG